MNQCELRGHLLKKFMNEINLRVLKQKFNVQQLNIQ